MAQNAPINSPPQKNTVDKLGDLMIGIAPAADIASTLDKFLKAIHGKVNPAEWQNVQQAQDDLTRIGFKGVLINEVVKTKAGVDLLREFLIDKQKVLKSTAEAHEELGKDALAGAFGDASEGLSEAYDKVFGEESKLSGGAKIAAGIGLIALGIFVAKKVGAWFKTGPGQMAGGVLAGGTIYVALAKLTETLTHGEQSLGLDTVGGWFDQMRGEDTDYLNTYKKLNLDNEWMEEWLATSKVPVGTLIALWRQESINGSGKREINPDDSLISHYLADLNLSENETAKKKWGTDLYDMLNHIFGRNTYIDQWKQPHKTSDLLKDYEHSNTTFGDFLTTLGAPEGPSIPEWFTDKISAIRKSVTDVLAAGISGLTLGATVILGNVAIMPVELGIKTIGKIIYDGDRGMYYILGLDETWEKVKNTGRIGYGKATQAAQYLKTQYKKHLALP